MRSRPSTPQETHARGATSPSRTATLSSACQLLRLPLGLLHHRQQRPAAGFAHHHRLRHHRRGHGRHAHLRAAGHGARDHPARHHHRRALAQFDRKCLRAAARQQGLARRGALGHQRHLGSGMTLFDPALFDPALFDAEEGAIEEPPSVTPAAPVAPMHDAPISLLVGTDALGWVELGGKAQLGQMTRAMPGGDGSLEFTPLRRRRPRGPQRHRARRPGQARGRRRPGVGRQGAHRPRARTPRLAVRAHRGRRRAQRLGGALLALRLPRHGHRHGAVAAHQAAV